MGLDLELDMIGGMVRIHKKVQMVVISEWCVVGQTDLNEEERISETVLASLNLQ